MTRTPRPRQNANEFQPDGSAADHDGRIAFAGAGFFDAAQHASQRFDQSGVDERKMWRDFNHVFAQNAAGDQARIPHKRRC